MDFFDRVKQASNPGDASMLDEFIGKLRMGQNWMIRTQKEKFPQNEKPGFQSPKWSDEFVEKWTGFMDQMEQLEATARKHHGFIGVTSRNGKYRTLRIVERS